MCKNIVLYLSLNSQKNCGIADLTPVTSILGNHITLGKAHYSFHVVLLLETRLNLELLIGWSIIFLNFFVRRRAFGLTLYTRDPCSFAVSSSGTVDVCISATLLDRHLSADAVSPTQQHLAGI